MTAQLPLLTEPGSAVFSPDGLYRYRLTRAWSEDPYALNVIGLNCSTATAEVDDPTIRRCIRFAQSWGYSRLVMTNLFAFRATDPLVMRLAADPVGPDNDEHIVRAAAESSMVLAAWGVHGGHLGRATEVQRLLGGVQLWCLGRTKGGEPRHPLYVRGDVSPKRWP